MNTAEPILPVPSTPRSSSTGVSVGTIVDSRYEIVRPIARGGMAEVVEARHLETGRPVVLKTLRRELIDRGDAIARLRREARALGSVQHPNVVGILDAGTCPRTGSYLVLEKLDGRPLDGLLAARGSIGIAGTVAVLRAVAAALAEVHRQGYVHRDLKPSNVFIAASRQGGESVKLLDFGIVGEVTAGIADRLTLSGDLLGTIGYMAPEQLADVTVSDPRSDLYSLGIVALECLGVTLEAFAKARRARRVARAALELRIDVPDTLLDLLDEMLSLSASERPSSAIEVAHRLEGLAGTGSPMLGYGGLAPAADRPTDCEPASRRARRVEGRRHLRAPYITPVRIVGPGEPIDGRSEDVSATGLLVVTRQPILAEGTVVVRFALPTTGRVIAVQAEPRWVREQGGRTAVGLEFVNLDPVAAEAIESYVRFVAADG